MGIDALDLVFRLEKRFGINIGRDEAMASWLQTAGDIHRYLIAKLRNEAGTVPNIFRLITEVSLSVNNVTGRWRRLIPSTNLNTKFPPATRPAQWQALEAALQVALPQLERTPDQTSPRVPPPVETELGLAYWIAEHYPERVEQLPIDCRRTGEMANHAWTDDEIWDVLRECICDVLGVKPEEVTPDARMSEDLGMG
jgi:acyl carrier protein